MRKVSKWHHIVNLATECTLSEYLESQQNDDITDLYFIEWSWYKLKGLSSPELALEEEKLENI